MSLHHNQHQVSLISYLSYYHVYVLQVHCKNLDPSDKNGYDYEYQNKILQLTLIYQKITWHINKDTFSRNSLREYNYNSYISKFLENIMMEIAIIFGDGL